MGRRRRVGGQGKVSPLRAVNAVRQGSGIAEGLLGVAGRWWAASCTL